EGAMLDGYALGRTVFAGARQGEHARSVGGNVGNASDFDYERRMNNWRMWRLSDRGSINGSPFPIYNLTPRPPRGENIMPILFGEAVETESAVQALPRAMRRTVEIWFLTSGSLNEKRKMLRCRRERLFEMVEEAKRELVAA